MGKVDYEAESRKHQSRADSLRGKLMRAEGALHAIEHHADGMDDVFNILLVYKSGHSESFAADWAAYRVVRRLAEEAAES